MEETKPKKERFATAGEITRKGSDRYVPTYEEIAEPPKRVVAASAALQKRGKTTFGFTMPKPLAYMQLDANYEHALSKARETYKTKKQPDGGIKHLRYFADPRADIKAANGAVWERLVRDFEYEVKNSRSVMVDTTSELLDVRKLAEFGRNTQIKQMYYGGFYADLRWMIKHALDNNANVLFVHRLKKEYINDNWGGGYELEGWRGIVYEAPIYIEHDRTEDGTFLTHIKECGQDANLNGMTLSSEDENNDFAGLATRIFPETGREEWL